MKEATGDDRQKTASASRVVGCERAAAGGMPNKPMVPTAPTGLIEYAPGSLRRHIGQPLGSFEERKTALLRKQFSDPDEGGRCRSRINEQQAS